MIEIALYVTGGAVIGAVLAYFIREKWQERRINGLLAHSQTLEDELALIKQRQYAEKARTAKADQSAEEQEAITEIVAALAKGGDIKATLGMMAIKYPRLAQKYAKGLL